MKPSLAEALAAQDDTPRGPQCTVAILLDDLAPEDATALTDALASTLPASAISRAVTATGHRLSQATIGRHRRGDCRCPR